MLFWVERFTAISPRRPLAAFGEPKSLAAASATGLLVTMSAWAALYWSELRGDGVALGWDVPPMSSVGSFGRRRTRAVAV